MVYSASHLRGLSRHYYKTHQRQHSECGLVSTAHRWLLYELFIKLFMQVVQSYSFRTLLIA